MGKHVQNPAAADGIRGDRFRSSMPQRRTKVTDYIEVKHVYHPGTGQLLGVFPIEDIPADPKKLIAFVRRKGKAAKGMCCK